MNCRSTSMASSELVGRISRAMERMGRAAVIDECLDEMGAALLGDGVRPELVRDTLGNIKATAVRLGDPAHCPDHGKRVERAIFIELCKRFSTGWPYFTPVKGSPSVIIFVGLQGSGKTTASARYARYHREKGWKPALVCVDTGDLDQLKPIAAEAQVPVYESYTESEPATIAAGGVESFKNEGYDLIIVVAGGEAALSEEFRQVSAATNPDLVVMVMDISVGQAASGQAQAFKQSVPVGAVIVTKSHSHAEGGVGALSVLAEAKTPVIFMGTGEHLEEFEAFAVQPLVCSLLGLRAWTGIMPPIRTPRPRNLSGGPGWTLNGLLRVLRDQRTLLAADRFRFHSHDFQKNLEGTQRRLSRYETIMEVMTNAERESTNPESIIDRARIATIARESGWRVDEVTEMLNHRKMSAFFGGVTIGTKRSRWGQAVSEPQVDV